MDSKNTRDTDADWRLIGIEEPYWGVLSGEKYKIRNVDDAALSDFYASGVHEVNGIVQKMTAILGEWPVPRRALDFGCGVGRLTRAMSPYAAEIIGYDISNAMLEKAKAVSEPSITFSNAWPSGQFDWINSYTVFQHIDPERGLRLLDKLLDSLAAGGVLSLHFTIFRDARLAPRASAAAVDAIRHVKRWIKRPVEPPVGSVAMYDYDLSSIFRRLVRHGIKQSTLFHTDHDGHHGVYIVGRRD